MSRNQKSEISRLKKFQITSNLDTSRKIVKQTFPESLTKIWQADVLQTYIRQNPPKFSPIHPNDRIFSVNMQN